MASLEELQSALKKADAAGDEDAARKFANAIRRAKGQGVETGRAVNTVGQGINAGLANAVGVFADVANRAPQILNILPGEQGMKPFVERPFGGSEHLRDVLANNPVHEFTYENIRDVPEEYRPYAKGGEVIGESIPFAAAPLARGAQLGTRTAKGVTAPIVESARTSPGTFAAAEASSTGGAALGAGIAETVAPGNEGAALVGEVGGGVLNPWSFLISKSRDLSRTVDNFASSMHPQGRRYAAGRRAQTLLREAGEDPSAVARRLKNTDPDMPSASAGLQGDSPTLLALERKLVRESSTFGDDVRQQVERSIDELNKSVRRAADSGDPRAMQAAVEARRNHYDNLLKTRFASAQAKADEALSRIAPDSPTARADANLKAREIMEGAYRDARSTERQLWQEIDRGAVVEPDATAGAFAQARDDLLPGEGLLLPEPVNNALKRAARALDDEVDEAAEITAGELLTLRSRLLAAADDFSTGATPNRDMARRIRIVADGILDDLGQVPGSDKARDFSRTLNQHLTQGYPGRALRTTGRGESAIAPEMTMERAIGSGGPQAAVNVRQMREGAQFGSLAGEGIDQAADQVLRDMVQKTTDNGKLNPRQLQTWISRNKDVLRQYPELARDLGDAASAQRLVDNVTARNATAQRALERSALSRVAGFEDATQGLRSVLKGKTPTKDLNQLVNTARRAGDDAVSGLRGATMNVVFDQATKRNGLIDGDELLKFLDSPPGKLLADKGVLTPQQRDVMKRLAHKAKRVQKALDSGRELDEVISSADAVTDLLMRVAGSTAATRGAFSGVTGGGNQLIIAQAGSKAFRRVFDRIPQGKIADVLKEAVRNPQMMADLLSMNAARPPKPEKFRRLNAYLLQLGVDPITDEEN